MRQQILYYLSFYKTQKQPLLLSLLLSLAQALSLFPIALIIQYLFDNALDARDTKMLFAGLGLAVLLIAINSLLILVNKRISFRVIKQIVCEIREKLLYKILFFDSAYFAEQDLDRVHSEIVQDTERLDNMAAVLLTQVLPGIFLITGVSIFLIYTNASLFFVLLFIFPLSYIAGRLMAEKLKASVKQYHLDFSAFSRGIYFVLKFSDLIKISSAENKELVNQKKILNQLDLSSRKVTWIASAYTTAQGNLFVIGAIVVLLFGTFQVIDGKTTVGSLISFYVLLNIVIAQFKNVLGVVPILIEGSASLSSLMPILQSTNKESSSQQLFQFADAIQLRNIEFGYDNNLVLKDLSLEIKKHQVIGIYGPSGSGKSTLIKLLLGIYSPTGGQILIDGVNLSELNIYEYRRCIGVLPQDPLFFPGTIYENLTYGIEGLSDDIITETCKRCLIHDFIISLPEGYNSEIGNSGKKISGGQRQRIAIARALLRNPEILILDEPDNNLDEATTFAIIENIRDMKITTFVISHNSFILPYVDQTLRL